MNGDFCEGVAKFFKS